MTHYSIDTRTIESGDVFIPVKGPNFDGRNFIPEAIKKGAHVLDVDLTKYATSYRKKLNCAVIGITGSAGKTTVKDLLYAILSQKFKVAKTYENENNEIGVPLTILKADHETEILLVEMAMRNLGDMAHLSKIVRPTHAIITNVGLSHLECVKTPRNIARGKAEIFRAPLSWETPDRYAFLNHETPYYDLLTQKAEKQSYKILPFGGQDKPEQNLNLCRMVCRHFGLTEDEIIQGVSAYNSSKRRLDVQQVKGITIVDDSYNANPDGVIYALQYCRRFQGRKIMVLGDMLELGKASKKAHQNIIPHAIDNDISMMFTYGEETGKIKPKTMPVYHFEDREQLHAQLGAELKTGDVVLVKGSRGMKMEETVSFLNNKLNDTLNDIRKETR